MIMTDRKVCSVGPSCCFKHRLLVWLVCTRRSEWLLCKVVHCSNRQSYCPPAHCPLVQMVRRYEALSSGAETVESQLKDRLVEHLNAELTLGTIRDVSQAVAWIQTTYLFVRVSISICVGGLITTALHTI